VALDSRIKDERIDELFEAILSLRSPDECYRFFYDLCTVGELRSLSQRWRAARMLATGRTYDEIVAETGMSTATISRIRRFLDYGADGYRLVLQRLGISRGSPPGEAPDDERGGAARRKGEDEAP